MLRSPARVVLTANERAIPVARHDVDGTPYDFRDGRRIGDLVLDHAFTGLDHGPDGRAVVGALRPRHRSPGRAVDRPVRTTTSWSSPATRSPRSDRRRGIAIEPMTCPPNAFRTGEDVIRLEPGASVTTTWGLRELEQP